MPRARTWASTHSAARSQTYFPATAAALAVPWLVARHVWGMNYVGAGPEGRYNGIAAVHQLCTLAWFGMAVAGSLKASGLLTTSAF